MAGRWLLKTEPKEWSWEHQQANGGVSQWDGVRNALAQKHLRAMAKGDLCFFYHSGSKAKEIVGIARVCKTFYPDPSDPASKHGMVDIEAVSKLALPLSLARLKQEDGLHSFIMFRQTRLSVVPVSSSEWDLICELAGQLEPPLPLDNGDAIFKVYSGETQASSLSSDDNGNIRMDVCNDECGVSLADMIDNPSQPSTTRGRKRSKVKSSIDGSRDKDTGTVLTVEGSRPRGKARVAEVEIAPNTLAQDSSKVPETSQGPELAPNSKRVYSRRNRKPIQFPGDGEAPTSLENVQSGAEQEAWEESMPTSAKFSDGRATVSVAGRVYKKRDRRQNLVEALPC